MKREANEQGGALNDRIFPNTSEVSKIPGGVGRGGGGSSHIKVMGMLVGKFKLNP